VLFLPYSCHAAPVLFYTVFLLSHVFTICCTAFSPLPFRFQMSGVMMMEADDELQQQEEQQQEDEDAAAAAVELEVGGRPQRNKGKAKAGGKAGARGTEGGQYATDLYVFRGPTLDMYSFVLMHDV
jgi:hypothetical protein